MKIIILDGYTTNPGDCSWEAVSDQGELVVFDPQSERVEGETAGHQTVVLKFESKEKAKAVYESGAYQAIVGTRLGATSGHFAVLVNGMG